MLWSLALSLLWFAGFAAVDGARAQNVVNGNFAFPSAAQAPGGVIVDPPTTAQTGWTFTNIAPANHSGVQQNGSEFGPPTAPDGQQQTGFIINLGSISQNIDFKQAGDYTLSFDIAARAGSTPNDQDNQHSLSIVVHIGSQQYGPYTPLSSSSFNKVTTPPFTIAQANSLVGLAFVGYGLGNGGQLLAGELSTAFIANVAIKPVAPQIATCTIDIDPTRTVKVSGQHFGPGKGKIRITFPSPSQVDFANSAFPNDKSKSNLDLMPSQWGDTITTEALDSASPVGAADAQPVQIYVIGANGLSSNACKANFHNIPVITGVSPGSITPSAHTPQTFNVSGWDFGDDPGKVTIHFTNNHYNSHSLDSNDNKGAQISKDAHGTYEWKAWVVNAIVPNVTAVVEQTVDISLTPKGGSASNAWKEKFKPRLVEQVVPSNLVSVLQCSNGGAANLCNNPSAGSMTCFGVNVANNIVGNTERTASVDLPNIPVSLYGAHFGCPAGGDSGTDVFQAVVNSPWTIVSAQYFDAVYQAGWNPSSSATPDTALTINVPWKTSADGGGIIYEIVIEAQGPQGVPLQ